jgi:hypothetical protein
MATAADPLGSDAGLLDSQADPLGFDPDRDYSKGDRLKIAVAEYDRQLKAYESGGPGKKKPNITKLARDWNVPPQSIRNHYIMPAQKFRDAADEDRRLLLPGEERALLERCLFMDDFSIPPDREMIEKLATVILHSRLPGHPPLGHHWVDRFVKRYPDECKFIHAKQIPADRANADNWEINVDFFEKLKRNIMKYKIEADTLWNMDEKGFILGLGKARKRLCRQGRRDPQFKEQGNRESCTTVCSISAEGKSVTPLIVFKGKTQLAGWHRKKKTEEYYYAVQENGYIDTHITIEYMTKIFGPETEKIAKNRWRMLIYDGFDTHLHPDVIEYLWRNKIVPFCLPPHTSHVLQPLDVGVFSSLQTAYGTAVNKQRAGVDKEDFPDLFAFARQRSFTRENIQAGFKQTGIWPFNPHQRLKSVRNPLENPSEDFRPTTPIEEPPYSPRLRPRTPEFYRSKPDDILYSPRTPTKPSEAQQLFEAALENLQGSKSPRSQRTVTFLRKLKDYGTKAYGDKMMALSGEQYLQEQLAFKAKKKVDKRQLKNDDAGKAFVVELGSTLHKAKVNRDEKEQREQAEKEKKQAEQLAAKERKQEEARIKKEEREKMQRERLRKKEAEKEAREEKKKAQLAAKIQAGSKRKNAE